MLLSPTSPGDRLHPALAGGRLAFLMLPCMLQGLYLLLVTNKASNILEDLETLRLLAKVVPEYVVGLHEEAIAAAAFDLIFVFHEVISLGHKVCVAWTLLNTGLL